MIIFFYIFNNQVDKFGLKYMFTNITNKTESKPLEQYLSEWSTFLMSDLQTVKDAIIDNQQYISNISGNDNKISIKKKSSNKKHLPIDWEEDDNRILGIKDNEQLINTIATYKKQKVGLGYIFIESTQYISVIIKKPNKYPLIVIRIPVEYPFVTINEKYIGLIYDFPIDVIYNKDSSNKIKSKQYRLYLMNNKNEVTLYYENVINNEIKKIKCDDIARYTTETINNILKVTMLKYVNSFELQKMSDLAYAINDMTILVIKKLANSQSVISLEPLQNKQTSYLTFDKNKLNYIIASNVRKDEQTLLTKDDSNYWPQIDYSGTNYVFHEFDNIFKLSHYGSKTTKDGIYYILSTFLNTYAFVILITDQNIMINSETEIYKFQDLFNRRTQILELYLLIEDKTAIC